MTEHLFQPQRQSCGCHSKSRITTAINLVVLSKGVSVFAQTHTCMVKTLIVHTSQFFYQAKLIKLCFLRLTNCIILYVPDDAHSWTKQRHCEDTPIGLFLKRKGWFCSFSCKCCSCIVVITILEFKVTLLDGAVFHGSISVLSHTFYWATSLNLTVIKLNGQQNSVWKNQVNTTCLCSDGTVIWATVLHGSLRNHYSYSIIFHSSAPCCSFPVSTTYHSLLNQILEKNTKKTSALADLLTVRLATLLYSSDSADGGYPGMFLRPIELNSLQTDFEWWKNLYDVNQLDKDYTSLVAAGLEFNGGGV